MRWSWKKPVVVDKYVDAYREWLKLNQWWLQWVKVLVVFLIAIIVTIAFQRNNWAPWTSFEGKKLWDWLELLGVPVSLAILGAWLQSSQQKQAEKAAAAQREAEAEENREDVLQVYFDRISALLIEKNLIGIANQKAKNDATTQQTEILETSLDIIRARTLSLLRRFERDKSRQRNVIQFLAEAEILSICQLNLSLRGANLEWAELQRTILSKTNLSSVNLRNANLEGANLQEVNLHYAVLDYATLEWSLLKEANLSYATLIESNLTKANLIRANLEGAVLEKACLEGVRLKRAVLKEANLKRSNLTNAYLNDANLEWAELELANLQGSHLNRANLEGANLKGVNLEGADLNNANLREANLEGANLRGADLKGAFIYQANFKDVNLNDARLNGAVIACVDLRTVDGLSKIQLQGDDPPLLCDSPCLPEIEINKNRDCDQVGDVLKKKYQ